MIYLFNSSEEVIKIVPSTAIKSFYQTQSLTSEKYISDRVDIELKALPEEILKQIEYVAIPDIQDKYRFHLFFVVREATEGNITEITGVQSGIEELRKSPVYDIRPQDRTVRFAAEQIIQGTNWTVGYAPDDVRVGNMNVYYSSAFEGLKTLCEKTDVEMQFFVEINGNKVGNRYIEFKKKIGKNVGRRVVYGHNALQIIKEVEKTDLVTALVGRGRGEEVSSAEENAGGVAGYGRKITFEDIEWKKANGDPVDKPLGQKYVEFPEMTAIYGVQTPTGKRPKFGFIEFDTDDKAEVLRRTYEALQWVSRPKVELKTSSVYLKDTYIGDTVRVIRHDRGLAYETRVFEIKIDRISGRCEIKLGDKLSGNDGLSVSKLSSQITNLENSLSQTVQNIVTNLPSADGFTRNWYTDREPSDPRVGDTWFKPDPEHEGHTIMLTWNGEVWEEILRTYNDTRVEDKLAEIDTQTQAMEEAIQANEAKAREALEQAGVSTNLATEAQRLADEAKQAHASLSQEVSEAKADLVQKGLELSQLTENFGVTERKVEELDGAIKETVTRADYDALTGRVSQAETTIESQAGEISQRLTRTEVDSLVNQKGYLSTSVFNNYKNETAQSLTQRFEEVRGLIPTINGGRNYLLDSRIVFIGSNDGANFPTISESLSEGERQFVRIRRHNPTINPNTFSIFSDIAKFSTSTPKTGKGRISFKARANTPVTMKMMGIRVQNGASFQLPWNTTDVQIGTEWQIYGFEIDFSELKTMSAVRANPFFIQDQNVDLSTFYLDLCEWQLESGEIVNDWTAAPEDLTLPFESFKNEYDRTAKHVIDNLSSVIQTDSQWYTTINNRLRTAEGNFDTLSRTKANQTDFQTVKTTTEMYERILGKTEGDVQTNASRLVMTSDVFQTEVSAVSPNTYESRFVNVLTGGTLSREHTETPNGFYYTSTPTNDGAVRIERCITSNGWWTIKFTAKGIQSVAIPLDIDFCDGDYQRVVVNSSRDNLWTTYKVSFNVQNWSESIYNFIDITVLAYVYLLVKDVMVYKGTGDKPYTDSFGAVSTKVTQLAGSWAVQNLDAHGKLLNQINLLADGSNRIDGRLTHITGQTKIDNAVITSAMIQSVDAGKITAGTLDAAKARIINLDINTLTGNKSTFLQSMWRATNSLSYIDGTKIQVRDSAGSYVEMNNVPEFRSSDPTGTATVMGMGRTHYLDKYGTSLGYIGMNLYDFDFGETRTYAGTKYGVWLSRGSGGFSINYMQDGGYVAGTNNVYYTTKAGESYPVSVIEAVMRYKGNSGNWGNFEWVKSTLSTLNGYGAWPWNTTFQPGDKVIIEKGTVSTYIASGYRRYLDCTTSSNGTPTVYTYTEARHQEGVVMEKSLWVKGEARVGSLRNDSDRRLKENIKLATSSALEELMALKVVEFDWKKSGKHQDYGLIAQEAGKFRVPASDEEDTESIDLTRLLHASVKAIQELTERVKELETRTIDRSH